MNGFMAQRPIRACSMPWHWLVVSPLGDAQPCCWASESVGSLRDSTVEQIWNGPVMTRLRAAIRDGYIDPVCKHAGCSFVQETERLHGLDAYDLRYRLGELIETNASNPRATLCVSGWARAEYWGMWSNRSAARLVIELPEPPETALTLQCLCRAFGGAPEPSVRVRVNGAEAGVWRFAFPEETHDSVWREALLPVDSLTGRRLDISFEMQTLSCPNDFDIPDGRRLGFGLSAFRVAQERLNR